MKKLNPFTIVLGINLLIFITYSIFIIINSSGGMYTPDYAEIFFISVPHWIICFFAALVLSFIKNMKQYVQGFLLSGLLILILGFSSCFG